MSVTRDDLVRLSEQHAALAEVAGLARHAYAVATGADDVRALWVAWKDAHAACEAAWVAYLAALDAAAMDEVGAALDAEGRP